MLNQNKISRKNTSAAQLWQTKVLRLLLGVIAVLGLAVWISGSGGNNIFETSQLGSSVTQPSNEIQLEIDKLTQEIVILKQDINGLSRAKREATQKGWLAVAYNTILCPGCSFRGVNELIDNIRKKITEKADERRALQSQQQEDTANAPEQEDIGAIVKIDKLTQEIVILKQDINGLIRAKKEAAQEGWVMVAYNTILCPGCSLWRVNELIDDIRKKITEKADERRALQSQQQEDTANAPEKWTYEKNADQSYDPFASLIDEDSGMSDEGLESSAADKNLKSTATNPCGQYDPTEFNEKDLPDVCPELGLSDDCSVKDVQNKLITGGFYHIPDKKNQKLDPISSVADGIIGACTEIALGNFYDSQKVKQIEKPCEVNKASASASPTESEEGCVDDVLAAKTEILKLELNTEILKEKKKKLNSLLNQINRKLDAYAARKEKRQLEDFRRYVQEDLDNIYGKPDDYYKGENELYKKKAEALQNFYKTERGLQRCIERATKNSECDSEAMAWDDTDKALQDIFNEYEDEMEDEIGKPVSEIQVGIERMKHLLKTCPNGSKAAKQSQLTDTEGWIEAMQEKQAVENIYDYMTSEYYVTNEDYETEDSEEEGNKLSCKHVRIAIEEHVAKQEELQESLTRFEESIKENEPIRDKNKENRRTLSGNCAGSGYGMTPGGIGGGMISAITPGLLGPLSSLNVFGNNWNVSVRSGGHDCIYTPALDGPGAEIGLQKFSYYYDGNKAQSAIGMIVGWTNFALPFVSVLAISALIYAGFLYITAGGNTEQTDKAKKIIIWVAIGIVLIISAYAIVNTLIGADTSSE